MIKIKIVLPTDHYSIRKVTIKRNKVRVAKLGSLEHIEIPDLEKGDVLKFIMGHHRTTITYDDVQNKKHIIVYMNYRREFPYLYMDTLKSCIATKIVDEKDFERPVYNHKKKPQMPYNIYTKTTLWFIILVSALFCSMPFIFEQTKMHHFAFLYGIFCLMGYIPILFKKVKISYQQYMTRSICFVIGAIILIPYFDISINSKIVLISLNLILLLQFFTKQKVNFKC